PGLGLGLAAGSGHGLLGCRGLGGAGPLGLGEARLKLGKPDRRGGLGLDPGLFARRDHGLLGGNGHLGAGLGAGCLLLLAHPRLDAAGDVLRDRLLAQRAELALGMCVSFWLAIELEQRHWRRSPYSTALRISKLSRLRAASRTRFSPTPNRSYAASA